jgi:hypothetical protein
MLTIARRLCLLPPPQCILFLFFGGLAFPRFLHLLFRLFGRTATLLLQVGDHALDLARHVLQRLVRIGPGCHRLCIRRRRLQLGEGRRVPRARS